MNNDHEWLFRLFGKGTHHAGWWLEIKSLPELMEYLQATDGRYGRAFQNYMQDSDYSQAVGHGKYPQEAGLTQLAYLRGLNQHRSIVESIVNLGMERAGLMINALYAHGKLYVNPAGGWNFGIGLGEPDAFLRSKTLAWPEFTAADIHLSRFPNGRHWYAYVGNVQVRDGDRLKFNTYEEAKAHAMAYLATEN